MDLVKQDLLLADDDMDDCLFFKEALEELPFDSTLTAVNDGVELMKLLATMKHDLPSILFLDLNMPLKTGYECLSEIKRNERLATLPIVILSTSFDPESMNLLYQKGAHYYIRKPGEFSKLKQLIHQVISLVSASDQGQPARVNFVLNVA